MEKSKTKRKEDRIDLKNTPPQKKSKRDSTNDKTARTSLRSIMPRGYKMMENMGYKEGETLGSNESALKEPIKVEINTKRRGIRAEKPDPSTMNDMQMSEQRFIKRESEMKNNKRLKKIWYRIQKVAFEMMGDSDLYNPGEDPRDFNVLWRSYVMQLNEEVAKNDLNNHSNNDNEDKNNMIPMVNESLEASPSIKGEKFGRPSTLIDCDTSIIGSRITKDTELAELEELSIEKRITKLNIFLRSEKYYCFFCGIKYKDEGDLYEHCPGVNEDDHK